MSMAAPQERWTILARIPEVVADEEARRTFRWGTSVSLACNDLPSASVLTVPACMTSPPSDFDYPYIAAADPSGLLVLCATHRSTPTVTYLICDARTGETIPLCSYWGARGGNDVGLVVSGERCVVAQLQPTSDGTGRATLLRYMVGESRWVQTELTYSPPLHRRHFWFGEGVLSHGGMLWWMDLAYGILACDPSSDKPELLYVPLPRVLDELLAPGEVHQGRYRCVRVSDGRIRYVEIHGSHAAPVVSTWVLADPASAGEWNPERSVRLADVWADQSYLATKLPRREPVLALLHPTDPDRVYFLLGWCMFALDLRRGMVVEFNDLFTLPKPSRYVKTSSYFLHAWQFDPSSTPSSDFVPTHLRKKKEIAAQTRMFALMRAKNKIAIKWKRPQNSLSGVQKGAMKKLTPSHVSKRRGISGKVVNQLASLTLN